MSLENTSSTLFTVGSGRIVGFLIGHAVRPIMKIFAVVTGLFFGALIYLHLQSQGIININWEKLQTMSESTLSMIANPMNGTEQLSTITANLGIPITEGVSAGLVLGFSKG